MIKYIVRISKDGEIVREVEAVSKYDAKARRERLQLLHPDCTIEVAHGSHSQIAFDGEGVGVRVE